MDQKLSKRLYWIARCANIASLLLHRFDDVKTNTCRYFAESKRIWIPKQYSWGWGRITQELTPPRCYYLGLWPNFWNTDNNKIVWADYLMTKNVYEMGAGPVIPGEYMTLTQKKALNDIETQFGTAALKTYSLSSQMSAADKAVYFDPWNGPGTAIEKRLDEEVFGFDKEDVKRYYQEKLAIDPRLKRYMECMRLNFPKLQKI